MTQMVANSQGVKPPPRDPVLAALERIEQRLDRLESAMQRADAALAQVPNVVAAATDTLDGVTARLQTRGVDVDERARAALATLERLTEPRVLASLEQAAALAPQLPGLIAAAADTADGIVERLQARGIDLDERLRTTLAIAERLTSPPALTAVSTALDHLEDLQFLLDSGVLDKPAVRLIGKVGQALAASAAEVPPRAGMFQAMRALGVPDIQRALGFTLRLAERFGASLREASSGNSSRALPQGDR
ncbi:MAG: DUF1641 domain-containing protein [Polyangiaceae bacterium]|jgi:uncharacterized protein YjgD (DUF1641 family)|nr:DUF1641 domain-containing protein [Polyangiaceae bacterium]